MMQVVMMKEVILLIAIICKCNDRSCIHLENDVSEPDEQIDDEGDDYNASERDIDSAFEHIKRLPCFCHLLQCAVRDIDKANLGAAVSFS